MLKVITIGCRVGYMDNYAYLLIDEKTGQSAIMDPSEVAPIVAKCHELNIKPEYIFNTHHHFDHTDGNLELKEIYGCKVVGNIADVERIPGIDIALEVGKPFALGESVAELIDVSAHTQGSVLWYFPKDKLMFSGDTLFNLCVGGLFEGTVEQLYGALEKIKQLPEDVIFYPGHEYTLSAVPMAEHLLSNCPELKAYIKMAKDNIAQGLPAGPVNLKLEKSCNPYLHAESLKKFSQLF